MMKIYVTFFTLMIFCSSVVLADATTDDLIRQFLNKTNNLNSTKTARGGISHNHNGRKHTHALPKSGLLHKHNHDKTSNTSRSQGHTSSGLGRASIISRKLSGNTMLLDSDTLPYIDAQNYKRYSDINKSLQKKLLRAIAPESISWHGLSTGSNEFSSQSKFEKLENKYIPEIEKLIRLAKAKDYIGKKKKIIFKKVLPKYNFEEGTFNTYFAPDIIDGNNISDRLLHNQSVSIKFGDEEVLVNKYDLKEMSFLHIDRKKAELIVNSLNNKREVIFILYGTGYYSLGSGVHHYYDFSGKSFELYSSKAPNKLLLRHYIESPFN